MIKTAVFCRTLSDTYLKQITQLGADSVDFGQIDLFPNDGERGYPDLDEVLSIKKKITSWGLEVNRVTLPNISAELMRGERGYEQEIENACNCLKVFSEAGFPLARQRFGADVFPDHSLKYQSVHRGGYTSRGESIAHLGGNPPIPAEEDLDTWWTKFCEVYGRLVPVAE